MPRTPEHAAKLDMQNGNTFWHDAIDKEIKELLDMDCFEFFPARHHTTLWGQVAEHYAPHGI